MVLTNFPWKKLTGCTISQVVELFSSNGRQSNRGWIKWITSTKFSSVCTCIFLSPISHSLSLTLLLYLSLSLSHPLSLSLSVCLSLTTTNCIHTTFADQIHIRYR